ncbi:MAG: DUF6607 family protein [Parvularculaceae bacterium]
MMLNNAFNRCLAAAALVALGGCAASAGAGEPINAVAGDSIASVKQAKFNKDRQSILAMAGDYKVTFDFTETVPFVEDYELKERKTSGGHEVVRVIADKGDFISLQHLLVVGPEESPVVVKHWRQDWRFEPARVLVFIGGNAWAWRDVPMNERGGTWSQTVYQVDDAPRYGAVGLWTYDDGVAEWTPPKEWRPLPRRDMTTRDDYNAIDAVNRHVITPWGWVHEQDNAKLILSGEPKVLVHEIGVNTYRRDENFPVAAAEEYWAATAGFWAGVRAEWNAIETENARFAITIKGETGDLYNPLLELARDVRDGEKNVDDALVRARGVIRKYVTANTGTLADRLRPTTKIAHRE